MYFDIHEQILIEMPDFAKRIIYDFIVARGVSGNEQAAEWIAKTHPNAERTRPDRWENRDGRLIFRWSVEWDQDLLTTSGGQAGSMVAASEQLRARNEALRKWVEWSGAKPPFEGQVIQAEGDKGVSYRFEFHDSVWVLVEFAEDKRR